MFLKIYRDRTGQFRWTLYSRNGRKLANTGEGYTHRAHCLRMMAKLFPLVPVR